VAQPDASWELSRWPDHYRIDAAALGPRRHELGDGTLRVYQPGDTRTEIVIPEAYARALACKRRTTSRAACCRFAGTPKSRRKREKEKERSRHDRSEGPPPFAPAPFLFFSCQYRHPRRAKRRASPRVEPASLLRGRVAPSVRHHRNPGADEKRRYHHDHHGRQHGVHGGESHRHRHVISLPMTVAPPG